MGLRSEAATANEAVTLLEVGGALYNGSVFLMLSEVPEVSELPGAGGCPLLGELPCNCSVVRRNTPHFGAASRRARESSRWSV